MADAEKAQQRTTSFAKEVRFDAQQESKLDQTKSVSEAFTKAKEQTKPRQKSAQEIAADLKKREGTSFAKEVKLDHQKANNLDQVKSLKEAYARTQKPKEVKQNVSGQQKPLGPKPAPAMDLKLPDSPERRAVDWQKHNKELAEGRDEHKARAAQVADDLKKRQGNDNQQSHSRGR